MRRVPRGGGGGDSDDDTSPPDHENKRPPNNGNVQQASSVAVAPSSPRKVKKPAVRSEPKKSEGRKQVKAEPVEVKVVQSGGR